MSIGLWRYPLSLRSTLSTKNKKPNNPNVETTIWADNNNALNAPRARSLLSSALIALLLFVSKLVCLPLIILYRLFTKIFAKQISLAYRLKLFYPTIIYFGKFFFFSLAVSIVAFILVVINGLHIRFVRQFHPLLLIPAFLLALSLFVTIRSFVCFAKPIYFIRLCFKHEDEVINGSRVRVYTGLPGCGKSLSMTYDGYLISKHQHKDLVFEHYDLEAAKHYKGFKQFPEAMQKDKEKILNVVASSVLHINNNPDAIPLLHSNYPIMDRLSRFNHQISIDHYLQNKRIPENAVWLLDESADIFSNRRSVGVTKSIEAENAILSDILSKLRHYGNWYMLFAEQDGAENFVGLRRVATSREFLNCEKLCRPTRLIHKLNRLTDTVLARGGFVRGVSKRKSLRRYDKLLNKFLFWRYDRLARKINSIGFFVVTYKDSAFSKSFLSTRNSTYAMPMNMPVKYESRTYRNDYVCQDKELLLSTFGNLFMPRTHKTTLFDKRKLITSLVDALNDDSRKHIKKRYGKDKFDIIDILLKNDDALAYAQKLAKRSNPP